MTFNFGGGARVDKLQRCTRMWFIHVLLLGLVSMASASFCSYFGNREPGYEPDLYKCRDYRDNSCCQPDEEEIGFDADPVFNGDVGGGCQGTVDRLRCWICDPEQNVFYRNEVLTLCEGMCNRLLSDCGGALWRDGRVRDYYNNGTALCREMGFNIADTDCFTSSARHIVGKRWGTLVMLLAGFLLTGMITKSSQLNVVLIGIVVTIILLANPSNAQQTRVQEVMGWANSISVFINDLANDQLLVEEAQALFDGVEYNEVPVNGSEIVKEIRQRLGLFAEDKINALNRMATAVADEYDRFIRGSRAQPYSNPEDLPPSVYRDSDASDHLPYDQLTFDRRFQWAVDLNQSSVKIASGLDRSGDDLLTQINISAALDPVFKENLAKDPFISYQFFGSLRGFLRVFPGRPWQRNVIGFREDYDPRFRPWFAAATSGPKDVVIIVDTSRSMGEFANNRWRIAKQTVRTILSTLTRDDFVNVVTYRSSHFDYDSNYLRYRDFQVLGCRQNALQSATAARQQELMDRLDKFSPAGGSDPIRAFEEAYSMLNNYPRTDCQRFVIWVTDEEHNDNDVRCEKGHLEPRGRTYVYVPGRLCDWVSTYEKLIDTVESNTQFTNIRTFSFSILPRNLVYATEVACAGNGSPQQIDTNRISAIRDQAMGYFDYLEQSTRPNSVIWTAPYVDAFGLGELVTIARPVVVENNRHIGVVGLDVRLSDIEQILFSQQWGSLYSFVTNEEGRVIIHPRLTPSAESITDLETPPLEILETQNNFPNISSLINALKNQETGNITYSDVPRPVLRGEDQDGIIFEEGTTSNYFYSSIDNTNYSFAYNFEDDDLTFIYPEDKNLTNSVPAIYHDLNGYRDVFPNIFNALMVQQPNTSVEFPFTLLTNLNSTVKLAPKTFCDPNRYLREYDYPSLTFIHDFLNGDGENYGCDDGVFEIRARPDTIITSGMEPKWKARNPRYDHIVSLSYIGTNAGVIRSFPGVRWPRSYDPTTRPYYHRAVANRGTLALSYAYYDAAGAGKVITLSEVLYLGKKSNDSFECTQAANRAERCECTSAMQCVTNLCERGRCVGTQVEGVVGIDIRYDDFHAEVMSRTRSMCQGNTRCYIIDDSSNVIFSEGLREASVLDTRNYNRVPLGKVEPGVMRDLVKEKNFFIPESVQVDYQGTCERLNYFVPASSEGIIQTAEEEDNYLQQRGPLRRFQNQIGCIKDIIRYRANPAAIPDSTSIISGTQESSCSSGTYYLTEIPNTNTYLLVVDNWMSGLVETRAGFTIGLNCLVDRTLFAAGAHRALNGTCNILDDPRDETAICPAIDITVQPQCTPTGQRGGGNVPHHLQWYIMGATVALCLLLN